MKQPPPFHRRARTQGRIDGGRKRRRISAGRSAEPSRAFFGSVSARSCRRILPQDSRRASPGKTLADQSVASFRIDPSHRFRAYERRPPRKGPPRHRRRSRKRYRLLLRLFHRLERIAAGVDSFFEVFDDRLRTDVFKIVAADMPALRFGQAFDIVGHEHGIFLPAFFWAV